MTGLLLGVRTGLDEIVFCMFVAVWPLSAAVADDGSVQRGGRPAECRVGLAAHLRQRHVNAAASSSHTRKPRLPLPDQRTDTRRTGH